MIEYIWSGTLRQTVPKLHTVRYNNRYDMNEVRLWCKQNCKGKFFMSPPWAGQEKYVQFQDTEDVTWFAVRWS